MFTRRTFKFAQGTKIIIVFNRLKYKLTVLLLSQIYCEGDLLSTVQMAQIFNDSKTFVDMKLKQSEESTLATFRAWQLQFPNPTEANIRQFVADNFDPEGSEFAPWIPQDHVPVPTFLSRIIDPKYEQFGQELHDLWLKLGRKISDDVRVSFIGLCINTWHVSYIIYRLLQDNPNLYSILYVPNPTIVPGGRFREFYYWDTYWVVLGLLHSQMFTTTRGMLSNFVSIVDRYGFVPNGGRLYYLGRSQPPMLIPMVKEYLDATNDVQFLRETIVSLEREFNYWSQPSKTVFVNGHILAVYSDRSSGPRPESYFEDVETAQDFATVEERNAFYAEIKGGAESGMDFSSRWFINNGTNRGTLKHIQISQIVPVELNAILYWNANLLAEFYYRIGNNREKEQEYRSKAESIYKAVQAVFWHEDVGAWLDWDLLNNQRRDFFVPTNLAPLWTNCFDQNNTVHLSSKVLEYIHRNELDSYPGGVPNSLELTGEQWDFPNVWPPMQVRFWFGPLCIV